MVKGGNTVVQVVGAIVVTVVLGVVDVVVVGSAKLDLVYTFIYWKTTG